ncbi:MAG TPA: spore germination protein [Bacillota bacterium]|nr:spore germination protein [Bacillota bacterium]
MKRSESKVKVIEAIMAGDTALIFNKEKTAVIISTKGWEKRSVSEPTTEMVVKGPHDGFVESIRTNTALLRRRIGHPSLTFESFIIGRKSKTDINIGYIKGIANEKIVAEVKRRIKRINIDGILSAGFVEQLIEDAPLSPFLTVGYTERPDVCAARLLEGRIAIFVDGTPVVNTVPNLFIESFQSPDDYNFRPFYSTFVRWGRYLAFLLSILSPAIYVALSTFHHELIPTPLLITMAASTEGTPFPALIEAIGMGIIFEILREAGIRQPRPIGQAVSIVGALVIGQATVSAGLVGAPIVITVALTAIASFVTPKQAEVTAFLRLTLTVLAGFLGAYGIIAGLIIILIHMASLRSFGVPYLSPIMPLTPGDLKDVAVRVPIWAMFKRPRLIGWHDPVRQEFRLMPHPPEDDGDDQE